jgi:molybdopterin-guanine dinucleotide biosynthesis protein A
VTGDAKSERKEGAADEAMSRSGLILGGGQSIRMGRPKAALPFGRSTILARLVAELIDEFRELVVIAAPRADETYPVEDLLRPFRDRIVILRDNKAFAGPVPALLRGLRAAQHPVVFACSCDLPLIRASVARELCQMLGDCDAVIPQINGRRQPLCAVYRRSSAEAIAEIARTGERRLTMITSQLKQRSIEEAELRRIDPDLRSFLNVNTPEDYARALAMAKVKGRES